MNSSITKWWDPVEAIYIFTYLCWIYLYILYIIYKNIYFYCISDQINASLVSISDLKIIKNNE